MQEITPLKEQLRTEATTSNPNFTQAMTNLASSPSVMGQIGAEVASASTMKLMEVKGLDLGKNPQGNLFIPPSTKYLAQLNKSYQEQAKATLTLRANDLFNKASEQMNSITSLSPQDIEVYHSTLSAGLKSISELAPTGVKQHLESSFEATLQNSAHQYTIKMQGQQREKTAETQAAYIDAETSAMGESAYQGDLKKAKEHFDNATSMLSQRLIDGNMSEPERIASEKKLNILIAQSELTGEAIRRMDMKGEEGMEKFLSELPNKKPKDMTYADYQVVMSGVERAISQREGLRRRDISKSQSELIGYTVANGTPPPENALMQFRNDASTEQYNNTMLRINSILSQRSRKEDAATALYNNHSSAAAWTSASPQAQKATFNRLTDEVMQSHALKNKPLTEVQAMTLVARTIPVATKVYTDALTTKIQTGSASDALQAAIALNEMANGSSQDLAKISGIDDKTKVAAAYMNLLATDKNRSEEDIVSMARDATYKTEDTKILDQAYSRFYRDNMLTSGKLNKFIGSIVEDKNLSIAYNSSLFKDEVRAVHEKFFRISNGNPDIAKQLTQDYVNRFYGTSMVNGSPEFMVNPIERILGNEVPAALPLIQQDIREVLSKQLIHNNQLYSKGVANMHYELQTPRAKDGTELTYENLYKKLHAVESATEDAQAKKASKDYKEFTSEFFAARPNKVIVSQKGGYTEEMELVIYPSKVMQMSEDHSQLGGFDVALRDKNGVLHRIEAMTEHAWERIHYIGNAEKINQQAGSIPRITAYNARLHAPDMTSINEWRAQILKQRGF